MKDIRTKSRAVPSSHPPPCDSSVDDLPEERNKDIDPDVLAKRITDPLIESMRKDLEKIDVSAYK